MLVKEVAKRAASKAIVSSTRASNKSRSDKMSVVLTAGLATLMTTFFPDLVPEFFFSRLTIVSCIAIGLNIGSNSFMSTSMFVSKYLVARIIYLFIICLPKSSKSSSRLSLKDSRRGSFFPSTKSLLFQLSQTYFQTTYLHLWYSTDKG